MKVILKEDLDNLDFNGIIIGIPSYVEINQHKDIIFKISSAKFNDEQKYYCVCYNPDYLPNGLSLCKETTELKSIFKFDSYNYYKFDSLLEFCQWYVQKQELPLPVFENETSPVRMKRGDRLKEVRDYVQQVLSIEYYKNFSVFNNEHSDAMKEFTQNMANKLKEQLVEWLEQEV